MLFATSPASAPAAAIVLTPPPTSLAPANAPLPPEGPRPADRVMYDHGNELRRLGASKFEISSGFGISMHFGSPTKRAYSDAVLRDTIDSAKLTLTSPKPDPTDLSPYQCAFYALTLNGVHHIISEGGHNPTRLLVFARDAAAGARLAEMLNPDFLGVPVEIRVEGAPAS